MPYETRTWTFLVGSVCRWHLRSVAKSGHCRPTQKPKYEKPQCTNSNTPAQYNTFSPFAFRLFCVNTTQVTTITITINPYPPSTYPDSPTHIGSPVNAPITPQHRRSAMVSHHACE
eukprot:2461248-Prymnesium_polylepis.2